MTDAAPRISLVLPAFNEQARLPSTLLALQQHIESHALDAEVLVVDNGSDDATSAVVHQAMTHFPALRLVRTERAGKGLAVRTGMLAATGRVRFFGDADLSWPLADLERFAALVGQGAPVVIGSREGYGARRVGEPAYRHVMGRVFNRLVQALAVPGIEDTQCGFKAFDAEAAEAIFSRTRVRGFGFDVEVLFLARRLHFPVQSVALHWEHKENSRVHAVRDTLKMVADVLSVRVNDARGLYGAR
ncbi:MAG: glycosyltransferase family 2 protein [Chloroflexi bacterium]|nr:glycosyltransferase family 2 protein [Chloroflexota bacterium]